MKHIYILAIVGILLIGCSVQPEPIEYGKDECIYCKMTIVEPQFGAELVTTKGKIFKFDAIECMFDYIYDETYPDAEYAFKLINTFTEPEELYDANSAYYLISETLPSPMGAFLSAYRSMGQALEFKEQYGGQIYTWSEINNVFEERFRFINEH